MPFFHFSLAFPEAGKLSRFLLCRKHSLLGAPCQCCFCRARESARSFFPPPRLFLSLSALFFRHSLFRAKSKRSWPVFRPLPPILSAAGPRFFGRAPGIFAIQAPCFQLRI